MPGSIRASVHPSAEAGGMIWVRGGDGAAALPELPDGTPVCSLAVDAGAGIVLAAAGAGVARPGVRLFRLRHAGADMHIGWHGVNAGKTMLHAIVQGGGVEAALRLLRDLRTEAEGKAAA